MSKDRKRLEDTILAESGLASIELVNALCDQSIASDLVSCLSDIPDGDLVRGLNYFRNNISART